MDLDATFEAKRREKVCHHSAITDYNQDWPRGGTLIFDSALFEIHTLNLQNFCSLWNRSTETDDKNFLYEDTRFENRWDRVWEGGNGRKRERSQSGGLISLCGLA